MTDVTGYRVHRAHVKLSKYEEILTLVSQLMSCARLAAARWLHGLLLRCTGDLRPAAKACGECILMVLVIVLSYKIVL